MNTKTEQSEN